MELSRIRGRNVMKISLYPEIVSETKPVKKRKLIRPQQKHKERFLNVISELNRNSILSELKSDIAKNQSFVMPIQKVDKYVGLEKFITETTKLGKDMLIKIGNTTYNLTEINAKRLLKIINKQLAPEEEHGSDKSLIQAFQKLHGDIVVKRFVKKDFKRRNHKGAFFPYTHNTSFNLIPYGVYATGEKQDHTDMCLINALRYGGLEEDTINRIKMMVKNRTIPLSKFNQLCKVAKIQIIVKKENSKNLSKFGTEYSRIFNIGLIDEHYFLIEKTNITSYAIEHYREIKDLSDFNSIYRKDNNRYKKSTQKYIDSFNLIELLKKHNLLSEMSIEDEISASSQYYDNVSNEIKSLDYDEENDMIPVNLPQNNYTYYENLVFDVESYENDDGIQIAYLVRTYNDNINNVFIGEDCCLQLLQSLKTNTRLIAHNCSFDYRFLMKDLNNIQSELTRGNRLINCKANFGNIKIELKDSYHLISDPLRNFPKMFGLSKVKEVMPYDLYNKETIEKRYINIQKVIDDYISKDDEEQFRNNIRRWKLEKDGTYDIIEYSSKYCEIDCILLWEGYNIFRKWMLDCVNLDIDNILTIASLSHRYLIKQGCYDGVYEMKGVPQMFIQGCVVGGRTMTANNQKIKVQDKINDFDAVSLYPSAMSRLSGFLLGKPKIITNTDYNDLKNKDGYFVDIRINSVGIKRAFPLVSVKNENGIRNFTNDIVGQTIRVDKTTLEDLINFQNITFDIIRGYYFDEGFNTKICETINYLFQERINKKKQKNPAQQIYKLIMNASYGKSIMKPIESKSVFFDNKDDFEIFMSRNYNWVRSFTEFGDKVKVNVIKPIEDHHNIAHVGVSILSMSKRIMNEVMCLAEDIHCDIYYQDTDSIHLKDRDISRIAEAFKTKYNRELIGTNMGQFHSDFEMDDCCDVYAICSIFLGKKSYIHKLRGTDKNGKEQIAYHIRMKGIPISCLLYTCKRLNYNSPLELYEDLYNHKSIEVDLTNDGTKVNFKMNNDYTIKTLSEFKRTIKF
jgi:hypothetical protein